MDYSSEISGSKQIDRKYFVTSSSPTATSEKMSRLFTLAVALTLLLVATTVLVNGHKENEEPKKKPCDKIKCKFGGKCEVDADNRPECSCDFVCTDQYQPVCGSDSETYSNKCELDRASCQERRKIVVQSQGACSHQSASGPTAHLNLCPRYQCTQQYQPVCGTDGVTYANRCILSGATCLSKGKIKLLSEGSCPRGDCPKFCTREYRPVCGSDGRTYSTACELRRLTCDSSVFVYVLYEGKCASGKQY